MQSLTLFVCVGGSCISVALLVSRLHGATRHYQLQLSVAHLLTSRYLRLLWWCQKGFAWRSFAASTAREAILISYYEKVNEYSQD